MCIKTKMFFKFIVFVFIPILIFSILFIDVVCSETFWKRGNLNYKYKSRSINKMSVIGIKNTRFLVHKDVEIVREFQNYSGGLSHEQIKFYELNKGDNISIRVVDGIITNIIHNDF